MPPLLLQQKGLPQEAEWPLLPRTVAKTAVVRRPFDARAWTLAAQCAGRPSSQAQPMIRHLGRAIRPVSSNTCRRCTSHSSLPGRWNPARGLHCLGKLACLERSTGCAGCTSRMEIRSCNMKASHGRLTACPATERRGDLAPPARAPVETVVQGDLSASSVGITPHAATRLPGLLMQGLPRGLGEVGPDRTPAEHHQYADPQADADAGSRLSGRHWPRVVVAAHVRHLREETMICVLKSTPDGAPAAFGRRAGRLLPVSDCNVGCAAPTTREPHPFVGRLHGWRSDWPACAGYVPPMSVARQLNGAFAGKPPQCPGSHRAAERMLVGRRLSGAFRFGSAARAEVGWTEPDRRGAPPVAGRRGLRPTPLPTDSRRNPRWVWTASGAGRDADVGLGRGSTREGTQTRKGIAAHFAGERP